MDTLFSIDEHRKTRQKEYNDLSEEIQVYKEVIKSQSDTPGVVMRAVNFGWKSSGVILKKLWCVKDLVLTIFQRSSTETKRI